MTNPLALIRDLPADFHEVHGHRPRIHNHAEMAAWLDKMADATLVAADNLTSIAASTRDPDAATKARQYLDAHNAIVAMRTAPGQERQ